MDIKNFKAGSYRKGYQYQYFLTEKINHNFFWTDPVINDLLEKASFKLGELNSFSRFVPDTDMRWSSKNRQFFTRCQSQGISFQSKQTL